MHAHRITAGRRAELAPTLPAETLRDGGRFEGSAETGRGPARDSVPDASPKPAFTADSERIVQGVASFMLASAEPHALSAEARPGPLGTLSLHARWR